MIPSGLKLPGMKRINQVMKISKLINEIRVSSARSELRSTLEYVWAWLSWWLLAAVEKIPSTRVRRAITPLITVIIILVIVVAGAIIVYILVITPTSTSTTTIYP